MKMLTVPLLVCVMMTLTGADAGICPTAWTEINGCCFLYVPTPMRWAAAEKSCQHQGGNLASVHSLLEYEAIRAMIQRITQTDPLTWIGGSNAVEVGTWLWSDGTPFIFKYWNTRQPDNYGGSEHCLNINSGGKWNDLPCSVTLPFVCSKKP